MSLSGISPRRTGHGCGDTNDDWISQSTIAEGGRYTEDWFGTVVIDGSSEGSPGKHSAIGYGIAQLCFDHEGEPKFEDLARCQRKWECPRRTKRSEIFARRSAIERAMLLLTVLTRLGQRRSACHTGHTTQKRMYGRTCTKPFGSSKKGSDKQFANERTNQVQQ